LEAHGAALLAKHKVMGGNFAYTLGYVSSDGRLCPVRNLGRNHYVLMADSPEIWVLGRRGSRNHGGRGQNVLLESGGVRFTSTRHAGWPGDDPFVNQRGQVAPGIGVEDAVVAPSHLAPVPALSADVLAP
jgi:hypothetical protein